jgi:hypothetical protein
VYSPMRGAANLAGCEIKLPVVHEGLYFVVWHFPVDWLCSRLSFVVLRGIFTGPRSQFNSANFAES